MSSSTPIHANPEVRRCAALIVDIAGTVALRSQLGDAAAGVQIRQLLEAIIAAAREHGGDFIKSYGDDVLATFQRDAVASAARVAIRAQQLAQAAGLQLYAGFHAGDVEFRQTMGHPDAIGLTVNIAARLHKLTEGAPGRIFLVEESLAGLTPDLRSRATPYGVQDLKGIGPLPIWTLEWRDDGAVTRVTVPASRPAEPQSLELRHADASLRIEAPRRSFAVGRSKECALCVPDPEPRVSSQHLLFEFSAGRWFVQDISRNGTWMRDETTGVESVLPRGRQLALPARGTLSLGRAAADDPDGHFRVSFVIARSS
jgi:adenylate cyclase